MKSKKKTKQFPENGNFSKENENEMKIKMKMVFKLLE